MSAIDSQGNRETIWYLTSEANGSVFLSTLRDKNGESVGWGYCLFLDGDWIPVHGPVFAERVIRLIPMPA